MIRDLSDGQQNVNELLVFWRRGTVCVRESVRASGRLIVVINQTSLSSEARERLKEEMKEGLRNIFGQKESRKQYYASCSCR